MNNAYEVLNNEQDRKVGEGKTVFHVMLTVPLQLYDRYRVWPPPSRPEPGAGPSRGYSQTPFNQPFSDPFFSAGFGGRAFHFTDPFDLFNSLFGDIHNIHRGFFEDDDPFFSDPFPSTFSRSPFGQPFGQSTRSPFGSLFGPGPMFSGLLGSANTRAYSQVSEAVGRSGQWVSQSTMTRSINGRTEQVTKRRDAQVSTGEPSIYPSMLTPVAQGNEHIVYSSPEGERYTINGVDQPLPLTNGTANAGRNAAPPQPPPQTRPAPQAITAAPSVPASSYYAPPPAQPVSVPAQAASPPPTYYAPSATSGSHAYPMSPPGLFDRAPAAHRDAIPADPRTSVHRTRSASSQGHNGGEYGVDSHPQPPLPHPLTTVPTTAYASSLSSYRSDRDKERHHRQERDSHHPHRAHASSSGQSADARRVAHHSHHAPAPSRDEQGAPPHKRWRVGGW